MKKTPETTTTREQHRRQVLAETTSDSGRTDRPSVAQKVPRKIFHPQTPAEEEETEMVPHTLLLQPWLLQLDEALDLERQDNNNPNQPRNIPEIRHPEKRPLPHHHQKEKLFQ